MGLLEKSTYMHTYISIQKHCKKKKNFKKKRLQQTFLYAHTYHIFIKHVYAHTYMYTPIHKKAKFCGLAAIPDLHSANAGLLDDLFEL